MPKIHSNWRELNVNERDALVTLAMNGSVNTVEIHKRIRDDPPSTTLGTTARALNQLEDMGYVDQYSHKHDKRMTVAELTDKGRTLVEKGVVNPGRVIES